MLKYTQEDLGGPWDWDLVPGVVAGVIGDQDGVYFLRGNSQVIQVRTADSAILAKKTEIETALKAHVAAGESGWEDAKKDREASLTDAKKLTKALSLVMKDYLNELRAQHSLGDITNAQLKAAIKAKL